MRTIPAAIKNRWNAGGPFIGSAGAPHTRVTVQPDWQLHDEYGVSTDDPTKMPFRWFQHLDNDQTEIEVPNIKSVSWDRSLDTDAAKCDIVLNNQWMVENGVLGFDSQLGIPGYFTFNHGDAAAASEWGQDANSWAGILIPNALLRTYQGYGGVDKDINDALDDGNIVLTGLWMIDDVQVGTDGLLHITARDMAKLLITQPIIPPLIPNGWYPLHYYRYWYSYDTNPAVPVYDETDPVENGPSGEGPKFITDVTMSNDGEGYWLVGTDGGIFSFGVPFFGSRGADDDDSPMRAIAADPLGQGYWCCAENGAVYTFGNVPFLGRAITSSPFRGMAAHPSGLGYYMVTESGHVYKFGEAAGPGATTATVENMHPADDVVDIAAHPGGNGFWIVDYQGHVYTGGDANYYGNGTPHLFDAITGIAATPSGEGYWLCLERGEVQAFGDADLFPPNGVWGPAQDPPVELNDPIQSIAATPSGNGYTLVGGDGGVFTFGDAPFFGSLVSDWISQEQHDGNIDDFSDVVTDLLRWCGFLAYGDGGDNVYGLVETTGAYPINPLSPDLFDKRFAIDPITQIKEAVGYIFRVDEEGAAHFESANWFEIGNNMDTGARTATLPLLDDIHQITDYTVTFAGGDVRSEIIISSDDPKYGFADTVTTRLDLTSDPLVGPLRRNMHLPALLVNRFITKESEQQRMAERIRDQIVFSFRQGVVSAPFNPAIQLNDQIRIKERTTSDTYVHYVRGMQVSHDLDGGAMTMQLTTNWLGDL